MKTKQNKIGTYLAVTAGVGCASSVTNAAIQIVDLSGLNNAPDSILTFPAVTGDSSSDILFSSSSDFGVLIKLGTSDFYADSSFQGGAYGGGYSGGIAIFPSDPDDYALWNLLGDSGNGFSVDTNWVAFKDSSSNYGWLSFTLNSLDTNVNAPITAFGSFVYDDSSTSPGTAISLETAIAAVPEPSSLALLALGSAGLIARRRRKN